MNTSNPLVELVESRSVYTGKTWQDINTGEAGILYHAKYKNISTEIIYIYRKSYIRIDELSSIIESKKEKYGTSYKIPKYILNGIKKWDCSEGDHSILCNYLYSGEYEWYESEFIDNYLSFIAALYLSYVLLSQTGILIEVDIISIVLEVYNKRLGSVMSRMGSEKDNSSIRKTDKNTCQMTCCDIKVDFIIINKRIYFRLKDFEKLISKAKYGFENKYRIPRYLCERIELWPHHEDDVPHLFEPGNMADDTNVDIDSYEYENEFDEYISYIAALFISDFLVVQEKTVIMIQILREVSRVFEEDDSLDISNENIDFLDKNQEPPIVEKPGYDEIPF